MFLDVRFLILLLETIINIRPMTDKDKLSFLYEIFIVK